MTKDAVFRGTTLAVLAMAGAAVLALALVGFAVLACLLAAIIGWRIAHAVSARDDDLLSDGAVLIVSGGVVQRASTSAVALLGAGRGRSIRSVLLEFLGDDAAPEIEAVARLERVGEPVNRLVRTSDGTAWELIGVPAGALIRLVLREARHQDERLRETDARIRAAEAIAATFRSENEVLQALANHGSIMAWHRDAAGNMDWSAGRVRTRTGEATPEQAVEMISARARASRQPALVGDVQRSRIEIAVGDEAETTSLHVTEILREDGSRIGFGTDAGSVAAAERTLARFMQTTTEIFAHLTVGLAIFDRNQALALFNPALVEIWNVAPTWLARRPTLRDILDELRAHRRLPEVEDFHSWRAGLQRLFENTDAADYEELWHLADGSKLQVLARPHPNGGLSFIFDDVTERMRLEQRYRHSIDLRRATLDGLAEGVAIFGANGRLLFVNEAFHRTWNTDGQSVTPAMHVRELIAFCSGVAHAPAVWRKLHGFITGEEKRKSWCTRLGTEDGRVLTARFAPLPDGSTLAVFADITNTVRGISLSSGRDTVPDLTSRARETLDVLADARELAAPKRDAGKDDGREAPVVSDTCGDATSR